MHNTDPDSASSDDIASYSGVEFFNNGASGQTGTIDLTDGHAGDEVEIFATSGDTAFYGYSGQSYLTVDTDLGAETDTSDTMFIAGDVTGSTAIVVSDTGESDGVHNPDSVRIAEVSGSASLGAFTLDDGTQTKGLWTYDLYMDDTNNNCQGICFVMASTANASAYSFASIIGVMSNAWSVTNGDWINRNGDLRYAALKSEPKTGAWAQIIGSNGSQSASVTVTPFENQSVTMDTGYKGKSHAFVVGFDRNIQTSGSGNLVIGAMLGATGARASFDNGDSASMNGHSVGLYASWTNAGTYIDAAHGNPGLDLPRTYRLALHHRKPNDRSHAMSEVFICDYVRTPIGRFGHGAGR